MEQTKNEFLLQTKDLFIGYKKGNTEHPVLKNLNLNLQAGQLTCLLGPNGIGKSTLIRTLSGVQKPLSGNVFLKKKDILDYKPHELAKVVSLVLTERIPGGNLSVFDVVALGRFPYTGWTGKLDTEDIEIVEKAIKNTAVKHLIEKNIHELSDGELQKVMIARALAQNGEIIFLDEPTAHLDVSNRIEIMNLLRNLSEETNKAILLSTHDLDLAIQTANRLWLCVGDSSFYSGVPEDLILEGKLAETFEKEGFTFDKYTGKFKIKRNYKKSINIIGKGLHFNWLLHALQRMSFNIDENAELVITVEEDKKKVVYRLINNGKEVIFNNIEYLLDHLKLNKI